MLDEPIEIEESLMIEEDQDMPIVTDLEEAENDQIYMDEEKEYEAEVQDVQ